jgi:hypothetical protein
VNRWRQRQPIDLRSGLWWALYLGVLLLDMELFSNGQPLELPALLHMLVLAGLSLLILPLAVNSALPEISPHALTDLGQPEPAT